MFKLLLLRYALAFLTPGLPFIPTIAITVNIYLIFKLSILTLVRFTIWMTLGLIMYFYYGITHSTLENPAEEIELTVDQSYMQQQQPTSNADHHQTTAVWDRHGYENKMAEDNWSQSKYTAGNSWNNKTTVNNDKSSKNWSESKNDTTNRQPTQPVPGGFGIFVDETQFPTWDD